MTMSGRLRKVELTPEAHRLVPGLPTWSKVGVTWVGTDGTLARVEVTGDVTIVWRDPGRGVGRRR